MKVAVYPGSFDPLTNGHIDIIKRSSDIFDKLIVAIGCNYSKRPLFDINERLDMMHVVLDDLNINNNIEIQSFDGLLMDFVEKTGSKVIVRGLRAVSDYEYELAIYLMNRSLNQKVDTVILMASENFSFISSAMIKEVAKLGGDVSDKVHPYIIKNLKKKFKLE
jgi:pantetheine-phosphate adenylyltransferase